MSKQICFFILLIISFFISCKKSDPAVDRTYYRFHPGVLAHVQIPVNKYFIYKDSASGVLDSVTVTQSTLEKKFQPAYTGTNFFDPDIPEHDYQLFTLLLTKHGVGASSDWFYGTASADPGTGWVPLPPPSDSMPVKLEEYDRPTNFYRRTVFYYSIPPTVFTSLTIEGRVYSNVVAYTHNGGGNNISSTYYWVNGLGIIKRQIKTSTSTTAALLIRNN